MVWGVGAGGVSPAEHSPDIEICPQLTCRCSSGQLMICPSCSKSSLLGTLVCCQSPVPLGSGMTSLGTIPTVLIFVWLRHCFHFVMSIFKQDKVLELRV